MDASGLQRTNAPRSAQNPNSHWPVNPRFKNLFDVGFKVDGFGERVTSFDCNMSKRKVANGMKVPVVLIRLINERIQ